MSKGKDQSPVEGAIFAHLKRHPVVSSGDIASALGLTRQAAHYHFIKLIRQGRLERIGAGRGSRYRLPKLAAFDKVYSLSGLQEDRAWQVILAAVPAIAQARVNVRSILSHTFTEMLNNAIDHSSGSTAHLTLHTDDRRATFEIVDNGVGVFRHVRQKLHLRSDLEAIQELTKGKRTTDPARHTGEGIFFTSRLVDQFVLDSRGLRWTVDNERNDQAIADVAKTDGTRVECQIDFDSPRKMTDVFAEFTSADAREFSASEVTIRLFELPGEFVSRSEAKRVASGLDRFRTVTIDFSGLNEAGQGFVDELFRVWAKAHPETQLLPINMSPAVTFMVKRGLATES
ncbi:MAG: DUF4325 domain-containing protein [Actinomycetota bacterium]